MGPNNKALLDLFRADSALRLAQSQLDAATRGVRIQQKRAELAEKAHADLSVRHKRTRAQQMELDTDLKARDARIEHLREQQSATENNKQFQNFLVEINKQKEERTRIEDAGVTKLADVESLQKQEAAQRDAVVAERAKAEQLQRDIGETTTQLEERINTLQPQRDAAAGAVPDQALAMFNRLADNFEGEALAAVGHIEGKQEGYFCTGCNMELVVDVYNRLMTRDAILNCPGCGRILYVPEELTPETAVRQKKVAKKSAPRKKKAPAADKPLKKGQKAAKSKKAVSSDVRRIMTTAAAESLRMAELAERAPAEVEVFVAGESAGTYKVESAAGFRRLIGGKMQAEDLEEAVEVKEAGGESAVPTTPQNPMPMESGDLVAEPAGVGAGSDE